jgi:hypothetical protein
VGIVSSIYSYISNFYSAVHNVLTPLSRVGRLYSCAWQKVYLVKGLSGRGFFAIYGRRLIWLTCRLCLGEVLSGLGVCCLLPLVISSISLCISIRVRDSIPFSPHKIGLEFEFQISWLFYIKSIAINWISCDEFLYSTHFSLTLLIHRINWVSLGINHRGQGL